ncbi:uncharacterized protein SPSK_09865 [Sporothrix schenckii 1099-18]|uniref:Uncharacterized protein n=2 Tax=Sporothrix schenckii TaxID=29908 RepID=U7Q1C1_SPOS1|nr:uncharacterized protein SPSK_09865 [Sporothrix schenckii 1099-18]ERT00491.1 hypothetical protein HMPREF1624_03864 [Sporothrix schenckii ATCC 58251]KJR85012.1 hypothetical protein SPSK_09865 [Sporothrix schenckii 1099-18]
MPSSITKEEFDSARTSTSSGPVRDNATAEAAIPAPDPAPAQRRSDPCYYDAAAREINGVPTVPYYIVARVINAIVPLVLLALSLVAEIHYDRGKWLNPMLTPGFTVWGVSLFDLYLIVLRGRRHHPHLRIMYDGIVLGAGTAVASGFLTAWAINESPQLTYGLSVPILIGMYTLMLMEFGIGIEGVVQLIKMRRGTWHYV